MTKQITGDARPSQAAQDTLVMASKTFAASFALLGFLILTGCDSSPYEFAPVSGTVTLDGEPIAEARVSFLPRASGGPNAGPSSTGVTDSEGRFELVALDGHEGAIVGTHRVRISTYRDEGVGNTDRIKVLAKEKIPKRYNHRTTLSQQVTSDGNASCDFDLKSKGSIVQNEEG